MDYLIVGKIVNTHGIRGELKVVPSTSDWSRFDYLYKVFVGPENALREYKVEHVRAHGNCILMTLRGIADMTAAEALKGQMLWVDRKNARKLDKDEYFLFDLVGLQVYEGEQLLGTLREVLQPGSNDVYVVRNDAGREVLIPALKWVVLEVDLDNKIMRVKLPDGLLDPEEVDAPGSQNASRSQEASDEV